MNNPLEELVVCTRGVQPKSRPKMNWKPGDPCRVDGKDIGRERGRMYNATVLETAFFSEGDYLQTKLVITAEVKGFDGKPVKQTWVHPKPVQSYKLKRAHLKDGVSA